MRYLRRASICIFAVLLCFINCICAFAAPTGSLQVVNVQSPVILYRAADADGELSADFSGAQLERLGDQNINADNAKLLEKFAKDNAILGQTGAPDGNGCVLFPGLEESVYLVRSTAQPAEFAPFLVCIPTTIAGKTVYDITATPKEEIPDETCPETEPTEPEANIPQTGYVQWPKYLFLGIGILSIGAGLYELLRGRRTRYE